MLTITPNIKKHIDFLKGLKNITNVEAKTVPLQWKQKINNVESIMFVIHKSNMYIDLVVPLSVADAPMDPTLTEHSDRLSMMINGLIDKTGYKDCIMCVNNDILESFYYMNPKNNIIEEVENVTIKTQLTFVEKNLVAYLLTLPFVEEVFLYEVANNPDHILIACNIINLNYTGTESCPLDNLYCSPHGTRYKVLVPIDVLTDISLQKTVVDNLNTYYDTHAFDATFMHMLYDPKVQPILPDYLQNKL
jgi:hypothetical protein